MTGESTGAPAPGTDGAAEGQPPPSLARKAIRGSVWTLAGHVSAQVLRIGSNLLLTRLLFPAVFGQMTLIQIFVLGLGMFSDIGTGPAIVQNPRGDEPRFLHTLWSVQVLRGFALWAGTWVIAWPVASFYGQPELFWLIPATGFASVLQGFESTAVHTAKRHLLYGRLTLMDLGAQVATVAAIIALVLLHRAWYGPDAPGAVWAVVGGNLVGSAVRLVLTHTTLDGIRHRFVLDRGIVRSQLAFGRWVFLSTALTFLAAQLDRLIFGRAIPLDLLGIYGIALMAASIPSEVVLKLGQAVVFPAFSRVATRPDFSRVFGGVRLLFLLGGALLVSGLVASGPYLVRVLYDARYAEAGWILQFLSVMAWFQILGIANEAALLALGKPHWLAAGNGLKVAGLALLVPAGFHLDGFRGALVGLVLAEVCKYGVSAVAAARRGLSGVARDLAVTGFIALTSAAGLWAGRALRLPSHPDLGGFLVAGTTVVLLWTVAVLGGWRRGHGSEILGLLRRGQA